MAVASPGDSPIAGTPGSFALDGEHGLELLVAEDGISASFRCHATTRIVGTTRRRTLPYPRLDWEGLVRWHAFDTASAAASVNPELRRLLEELAVVGAVDVRIASDAGQIHLVFRDKPAPVEAVRAAAATIVRAVAHLPLPDKAPEPTGNLLDLPARVLGARVVDLDRFVELAKSPRTPLPDRDDPMIIREGGASTVGRALVVDFDSAVSSRELMLEVWPHEALEDEAGDLGVADILDPSDPTERPFRLGWAFAVKVREAGELFWRLLWHSQVAVQGKVPVGPYPRQLIDHLAARLPGASIDRGELVVDAVPRVRIRFEGDWAGEATEPLPDSFLDWDPLHRAGYVLFGKRFLRAFGTGGPREVPDPPTLRVEAGVGRHLLSWASHRRIADLRREARLSVSRDVHGAIVTSRLRRLPPSLIERRVRAALSVIEILRDRE